MLNRTLAALQETMKGGQLGSSAPAGPHVPIVLQLENHRAGEDVLAAIQLYYAGIGEQIRQLCTCVGSNPPFLHVGLSHESESNAADETTKTMTMTNTAMTTTQLRQLAVMIRKRGAAEAPGASADCLQKQTRRREDECGGSGQPVADRRRLNRRGCYNLWSESERTALELGVEKHGKGAWARILGDPEFKDSLKRRTNVDLKDKYRGDSQIGRTYTLSAKRHVEGITLQRGWSYGEGR